jgi:hypothetical protein
MPKAKLDSKRLGRPLLTAVAITAIVFLTPLLSNAIPITRYQSNLQRAIAELERVAKPAEGESSSAYEQRLRNAITAVQTGLPEKHSVEFGENTLTVDNSWLHRELGDLEKTTEEERDTKVKRLLERIRALEERVAEVQQASATGPGSLNSKERLAGILNRSEYSSSDTGRNALVRLMDDFKRWLQEHLPKIGPLNPSGANVVITIAQYVVLGLATALIIYVVILVIRRLQRRERRPRAKKEPRIVLGEQLEPEESSTDLLSDAEALARNGDLRAAIRKAYIALLVELGDRKVLTLAQHKTNRDYLTAVRSLPPLHSIMTGLTLSFERHWYGFAQATQTDWLEFRNGYQSALQIKG